jgi:hypothetical protein
MIILRMKNNEKTNHQLCENPTYKNIITTKNIFSISGLNIEYLLHMDSDIKIEHLLLTGAIILHYRYVT